MEAGGKLSQTKRKIRFPLFTEEEVERFSAIVDEAFEAELDSHEGPLP
jgi:hypothetical protein